MQYLLGPLNLVVLEQVQLQVDFKGKKGLNDGQSTSVTEGHTVQDILSTFQVIR